MMISPCGFCKPSHDFATSASLESILPSQYEVSVCSFEQLDGSNFKSKIRLHISSEEEVQSWLAAFKKGTDTTWRVARTYPDAGKFNTFRVDLRCQHNTGHKSKPGKVTKNTCCPASMFVVLKRPVKYSRSTDPHIKNGLLFIVTLHYTHNHSLSCADVLRKNDVSQATEEKLKSLFESGHSPSSALDVLKYDLQEEQGENYIHASANRSICPDLQFCYRLYAKIYDKVSGATSGEDMFADLERKIHEFNEEQHETCAVLEVTPDKQTIVAIVTPLMKRVHESIEHSGKMVFVDSSGNCDRHNSRIFVMLTHSSAGGLPLGMIVTTSDSLPTITAGFNLLKSILPERAFFRRGAMGPHVVMTDDCQALRQGLHAVYPQSTMILSAFHLLQAQWRWLWNTHHGIPKHDRPYLLGLLKGLIYADSSVELNACYHQMQTDDTVAKHQKFKAHLEDVFARRNEWALCLHQAAELPLRGNVTNNFIESAVRVIKEKVFHRLKAYNVTQLFHFLVTRLAAYYECRLVDVAKNRVTNPAQSKYYGNVKDVNVDAIGKDSGSTYTVPSGKSSGEVYYVNTDLETCTCSKGTSGGPCKHQYAVMEKFHLASTNILPTTTPHLRKLYYTIATGRADVPDNWFANLHEEGHFPPDEGETMMNASSSGTLHHQLHRTDSPQLQRELQNASPHRGKSTTHTHSLAERLQRIAETLRGKLEEDEDSFTAPITRFVERFENMVTDSSLVSALSTFGKYSGSSVSKKAGRVAGKRIGVQPTAISRRKTRVSGRRAGRPVKRSQREHKHARLKVSKSNSR